ncbi:MAG: hypothetical protein R3C13_05915 [Hyphomonas sp.]|uniref:NtrZ family periplasmic regulatory protein n=1 Tax=Hyphomonas sp. TaxID=87 RepID=UPI0035282DCB
MTALALPAAAQEAAPAPSTQLDSPQISDTRAGSVDWYRQFALAKPTEARPVWQAEPSEDVSMQFGGNTRWEFSLDKLSRPDSAVSPLPREEMQAGATFKITPRLSVGGEVSVGADKLNDVTQWEERNVEAGIRLKSAFKF